MARMSFRKRAWSQAVPTIVEGIRFRSKTEARVYQRLALQAKAEGARLYREIRFPLLNLAPDKHGKPLYFNPDFVLAYPDGTYRVIDAKSQTRKSRDWNRGKKAFEGLYEILVEETDE